MNYFYDALTNLFYCDINKQAYIDAGTWPEDMVEVPAETFTEFAGTPPNGKIRIAGDDGLPAWSDLPPPTTEEKLHVVEAMRTQLLAYADAITADWRTELALDEISDGDKDKLSAWMAYKREVKAISGESAIADGFEWPPQPEL